MLNQLIIKFYTCRFSKKYLILAGIWFSKDKPTMESYMHPLVEKVNELYYDGMLNLNLCFNSPIFHFTGVDVDTPIGKRKAHAAIIVCSTDRPACALVANNMQYNGHFGCTTCDSYGTSVGRTVYWPYDDASNLRTHQSILSSALEAVQCRKPVSSNSEILLSMITILYHVITIRCKESREFLFYLCIHHLILSKAWLWMIYTVLILVLLRLCVHIGFLQTRGQPYNIYEKVILCTYHFSVYNRLTNVMRV